MDQATQATEVVEKASFHYRKNKDSGVKRASVEVDYKVPTTAGLISYLQGDNQKVKDMIRDAVLGVTNGHLRSFVDSDENFDQAKADQLGAEGKLSLEYIANLPKADRNQVTREALEAFAKSYMEVIKASTDKSAAKIEAAAGLLVNRFNPIRGDEAALAVMEGQLAIYAENAGEEALAEHTAALNFLVAKLEDLQSAKITADDL